MGVFYTRKSPWSMAFPKYAPLNYTSGGAIYFGNTLLPKIELILSIYVVEKKY
jgi:hypothetical protein